MPSATITDSHTTFFTHENAFGQNIEAGFALQASTVSPNPLRFPMMRTTDILMLLLPLDYIIKRILAVRDIRIPWNFSVPCLVCYLEEPVLMLKWAITHFFTQSQVSRANKRQSCRLCPDQTSGSPTWNCWSNQPKHTNPTIPPSCATTPKPPFITLAKLRAGLSPHCVCYCAEGLLESSILVDVMAGLGTVRYNELELKSNLWYAYKSGVNWTDCLVY